MKKNFVLRVLLAAILALVLQLVLTGAPPTKADPVSEGVYNTTWTTVSSTATQIVTAGTASSVTLNDGSVVALDNAFTATMTESIGLTLPPSNLFNGAAYSGQCRFGDKGESAEVMNTPSVGIASSTIYQSYYGGYGGHPYIVRGSYLCPTYCTFFYTVNTNNDPWRLPLNVQWAGSGQGYLAYAICHR